MTKEEKAVIVAMTKETLAVLAVFALTWLMVTIAFEVILK